MTIEITGYHTANVLDNKDPLAKQSRTAIRELVVTAGGKMKRFDVYGGVMFIDVDTEKASSAIINRFSELEGVKAGVVDTLQAILHKSHLKPTPVDQTKSKA